MQGLFFHMWRSSSALWGLRLRPALGLRCAAKVEIHNHSLLLLDVCTSSVLPLQQATLPLSTPVKSSIGDRYCGGGWKGHKQVVSTRPFVSSSEPGVSSDDGIDPGPATNYARLVQSGTVKPGDTNQVRCFILVVHPTPGTLLNT